jgi:hypothetical protein
MAFPLSFISFVILSPDLISLSFCDSSIAGLPLPIGDPYDTVSIELVPLMGRLPRDEELEAVVFAEMVLFEEDPDAMMVDESSLKSFERYVFLGGVRYGSGDDDMVGMRSSG